MNAGKCRILIVGDSKRMRGGVSTVIQSLEVMPFWTNHQCKWIQCQINSNLFAKLWMFAKSFFCYCIAICKYDVIFFHTTPGNSMKVQLPFFVLAKIFKKKIATELHVGNQMLQHFQEKLFRYWINRSNVVITLGKQWRDLLIQEKWVTTKIEYLYNPAPEIIAPMPPKQYFLFAAYFAENKGYDYLLLAFSQIVPRHPDWKLLLCGTGDIRHVNDLIQWYKLTDNVELCGWVEGERKIEIFREAYAYCMTSKNEGLPMSVLESLSYGVPVISTYAGSLPEILEGNGCALMFEYGEVESLVQNIEFLIDNPKEREQMSLSAQHVSRNLLSKTEFCCRLESIIESLYLC